MNIYLVHFMHHNNLLQTEIYIGPFVHPSPKLLNLVTSWDVFELETLFLNKKVTVFILIIFGIKTIYV